MQHAATQMAALTCVTHGLARSVFHGPFFLAEVRLNVFSPLDAGTCWVSSSVHKESVRDEIKEKICHYCSSFNMFDMLM